MGRSKLGVGYTYTRNPGCETEGLESTLRQRPFRVCPEDCAYCDNGGGQKNLLIKGSEGNQIVSPMESHHYNSENFG